MSCSPVELAEKNQSVLVTWQRYRKDSTFENFVEFAISLNSFTEFLIAKGPNGLLHSARELEQSALNLFGDERTHPINDLALQDIHGRVHTISRLIEQQIASANQQQERREHNGETAHEIQRSRDVWLIAQDKEPWRDLLSQLGYFGVRVDYFTWQHLPAPMQSNPIVMIDITGLEPASWAVQIRSLRQQFAGSQMICLSMQSDFNNLQMALQAGCDTCFPDDTPLQAIVAHVLELNDPLEQEAFRVLVVEDSSTAIKLIQRALEEHKIVSKAINDPRHVLDELRDFQPDLILMDMYMPKCTGVEAARVIRQHAQFLSIPIVYLSGETDVALQIDALRLGGDHFLTKPFNPVFLNAIVKSKIERYRSLRRSMYHDSLTGLLNHTSTKSALDRALAESEKDQRPVSVVMVDIDYFKKVNDTYGHPVGDQVIRSLAWLLKQRLRKTDIIGRYGGEEFLVGLVGSTPQQALKTMDKIRKDFNLIQPPYGDSYFNISFSGGIASYPEYGDREELVLRADEALYRAKRGGRNQLAVAQAEAAV